VRHVGEEVRLRAVRILEFARALGDAQLQSLVEIGESIRPRSLNGLPARRNGVLEPVPNRAICILC